MLLRLCARPPGQFGQQLLKGDLLPDSEGREIVQTSQLLNSGPVLEIPGLTRTTKQSDGAVGQGLDERRFLFRFQSPILSNGRVDPAATTGDLVECLRAPDDISLCESLGFP